ncbi:MAG: hypothetical protein V2B18_03730 [Pseudomonadota bacterium]
MDITREEVRAELTRDGYQPFLKTIIGSVIDAEAWTIKSGSKPTVIILYRRDTGEVVDPGSIPEDEQSPSELMAFLDDFGERVFRPQ